MRILFRLALVAAIIATSVSPADARKKQHPKPASPSQPSATQIEAATRLQIFLDRANFSPGAINGHYDDRSRQTFQFSVCRFFSDTIVIY